jgi:phosphonate transport system substrate-binding protein
MINYNHLEENNMMKENERVSLLTILSICLLVAIGIGCEGKSGQSDQTVSSTSRQHIVTTGEPLKIAYLICNSSEETVERFAAEAAYIGERLGRKIIMYPFHAYQAEDVFRKIDVKFAKTNSIVYIQLKHYMDVDLMAGEKRGPDGRFTTGTIISMKGSGIKTMQDLKGKKFAFGPMFAPFGYLVQYDMMLKAGIDPEEDLAYYAIPWGAYKHEKTIYGIYFGGYEASAGPSLDLQLLTKQDKIKMEDFNIIAESEKAPYCTFWATNDVDPDLRDKILQTILDIDHKSDVYMHPDRLQVLSIEIANDGTVEETPIEWDKPGGYLQTGEVLNVCRTGIIDGFEEAKDSDYDVLRDMMKNAKMDPYSEY